MKELWPNIKNKKVYKQKMLTIHLQQTTKTYRQTISSYPTILKERTRIIFLAETFMPQIHDL